ncbi:MAG: hypothetical protein M3Q07_23555 [Pseudobdellovibrionaceae bacterium]|nr:hypothetical protein [Pseudobdellovibrionaceae bacterium]
MSEPYTKQGAKYWIVNFVCQQENKNGSFITLYQSRPVQSSKEFLPGVALQMAARTLGGSGKGGREQSWTYAIVSVQSTNRSDLESYCVDFDHGRYLIDLDEKEALGSKLIFENP